MMSLVVALALMAAPGGQGEVTAALIVRAPGAAARDSGAVAAAVRRALTAAGITIVERGAATSAPGARASVATFLVDVTTKAMGRVGLVDLRAANPGTSALITRVSRRALAADLADSAAVAARALAAGMLASQKASKPGAGKPKAATPSPAAPAPLLLEHHVDGDALRPEPVEVALQRR